jgi:hypothetical protein
MIRVRLPGGVCTPEQWLHMDAISDEHGNSTFKLTTRQVSPSPLSCRRELIIRPSSSTVSSRSTSSPLCRLSTGVVSIPSPLVVMSVSGSCCLQGTLLTVRPKRSMFRQPIGLASPQGGLRVLQGSIRASPSQHHRLPRDLARQKEGRR